MTRLAAISPGRAEGYSLRINGFRGVCVALVFLHHVANPAARKGWAAQATRVASSAETT